MKYYAVIDTNVLVSAMLKWNSIPGNVMEFVFRGVIIPLLNEGIMKEYENVLKRPKFHLTEAVVYNKDRIFYEVVMEERKAEDAYLVTGKIKASGAAVCIFCWLHQVLGLK
ncbi:MAG: PIN domain-containing protein [Lachnospiraceae bacterium]|jgi:predicted nucleic acid-binding protein|nr:PIN domain-containing protein [Lachnospiraceae bacterium]